MRKSKLFFANALLLSAVSIFIRLVGVSFNAFISVKVGAECMGLFTLVMSVYGLSVTFASSGINLAVVKKTSQVAAEYGEGGERTKRLRAVMRAAVLYSLFFGVLTGTAVYTFSEFIGERLLCDPRTVPSLRMFSLSLPLIAVSSALSGYFTGMRRVVKNAAVSLTEQLVKILIICTGMVLVSSGGIEKACLAIVGGGAAAEGASLVSSLVFYLWDKDVKRGGVRLRKKALRPDPLGKGERRGCSYGGLRVKDDGVKRGGVSVQKRGALQGGCFRESFSEVTRLALPVAVGAYARQGLLTAEHLAIPGGLRRYGLDPSGALAAYGVMHGMVMPLVLFPSAVLYSFAGLLVPELSECSAVGDRERAVAIGEKVFRSSLLFSVCVAGIFLSFSDAVGMTVYQSTEAARQLHLISALIPVMYLDSAVDGMLKGLGEQVYCMKVNVADSFLCLVLVLVMVPAFGIDGYIALLIISEVINASFSIARLVKVTGIRIRFFKWVLSPVASVMGAAAAVKLISAVLPALRGLVPSVVLCVLLYVVFCFLSGAAKKQDLLWLGSLLGISKGSGRKEKKQKKNLGYALRNI